MINVKNGSLKRVLLLFAAGAVVALCTINVKIGMTDYNKTSTSLLTLEALADGEGSTTEGNHCPDPYDVPHRYIQLVSSSSQQKTTNSKGEISVTINGKVTTKGGYEKNKTIYVIVSIFNCSGTADWACCKQSDVRVEID
jgi:hypothetical protein